MTFPYDKARLDALVADVDARMAAAERVSREASQVQLRSKGLSEADYAEISRFANSAAAPRELRDLARRIDAGEMTWQDIASGERAGDESVQRALQSGVPELQRAYNALEEGDDPQDVVAAGQPRSARRGDDDDEPGQFTQDAW
ncbi:hypothetical protein ABZ816_13150 [Actinosynnema sp. NPDC047251]|uniref:Uncharacterized protein n=1 Tax=Saccharothrix espanaensis (strain ATCC 51144 / DSM 44229 / JCM 9112 / NBRC 15066 / NRRL 15764) TaxID=1179773 RepID=K0KFK9_SACES|nr:hypothetical protein [Saccharothrix espanaensis]CCH35544.1 hypothetical protein BN6_83270 [Saccharothrix espanaensis DSM 44229]